MVMTSPLSKLLVVGALCWVAPVSAEPSDGSDQAWTGETPTCPEEIAKRAQAQQSVIRTDAPLFQHRGQAAEMLP
jgi:hypothetical protein